MGRSCTRGDWFLRPSLSSASQTTAEYNLSRICVSVISAMQIPSIDHMGICLCLSEGQFYNLPGGSRGQQGRGAIAMVHLIYAVTIEGARPLGRIALTSLVLLPLVLGCSESNP